MPNLFKYFKSAFYAIQLAAMFAACNPLGPGLKTQFPAACEIQYLYIYNNSDTNSKPTDSLILCKSGHDESLVLYENKDSFYKSVFNEITLAVFTINKQKFALIQDSNIRLFKSIFGHFKPVLTIPASTWIAPIKIIKTDLNSDSQTDLILKVHIGSSYGEGAFCLFYNPSTQNFMYDPNIDLANINYNASAKTIESFHSTFSKLYAIANFKLIPKEQRIYLNKTNNSKALSNKIELTKFDTKGNTISIDTLEAE